MLWIAGARPRTLPAAVVPVAVGAASAAGVESPVWWRVLPALVVSLALQVGVNYANDYSDGVKGTDADRVGPLRLVGSGLASPSAVKRAAFAALGVAGVAGFVLAAVTTWWLLAVGAAAMVAAWTYTGGPRPYGYAGLGEIFVFVFFGLVATIGTEYVTAVSVSATAVASSVAVGSVACALLVVNNLRDREGDVRSGKITLAVRLGDRATRAFFVALAALTAGGVVVASLVAGVSALLGLIGVAALVPAVRAVLAGAEGRALVEVLAMVGRAQLVLGATLAVGIAVAVS
jgi:1,4-dihydroxy-2-naphthoate octaprenyltransferase